MPRNMSFALTTEQIRDRSKTETRRVGWGRLRPGEQFWAVVKAQGLKKGEKIERIALLECVTNNREWLTAMTPAACRREGFPDMTPAEFIEMFCRNMNIGQQREINVIRFKYIDGPPAP